MPKYVVMLHRFSKYVIIHREDCKHARRPGTDTLSTKWFGYYYIYEAALRFAFKWKSEKSIRVCKICLPEIDSSDASL